MINEINNILLVKYLRNELTDSEREVVLRWLDDKDENKEFLFGLKEAYQLSRWEEFQSRSDVESGWKQLTEHIGQHPVSTKSTFGLFAWWQYAAAVVILVMSGFWLREAIGMMDKPSFNTLLTGAGEQSTLYLNDGSKVKINENSKLTYPSQFSEKNRNVSLLGEAYFEVAHNPKRPFQVNIGAYTVRVLGTKFNIDAYPDQIYLYTGLKEGKVQIIENNKDGKILSELKPGMQFSYNRRTGEYFVKLVDVDQMADWLGGQMIMKRQTLQEVARRLTEKYGYKIVIQNPKIGELTYNITIDKEPLEEILSNIHFITPQVSYALDEKHKTVVLR
jgi:ferric-dicitrate binding protein FerR (iron transport regulator)